MKIGNGSGGVPAAVKPRGGPFLIQQRVVVAFSLIPFAFSLIPFAVSLSPS
jgi:hypothetical protein